MIFRLQALSPKLFSTSNLHDAPAAIRRNLFVYSKPFLLATVISVVLSFFIGIALVVVTSWLSAGAKAPDMELNAPAAKTATQLPPYGTGIKKS